MCKATNAFLLLALLVSLSSLGCRRSEPPTGTGAGAQPESRQSEPDEKRAPPPAVARQEGEDREEAEERDEDSEEARENAEEAHMRQRALEQLQAYRARNCTEAIAKITELLRTQKGRWLERNERGQIPTDLLKTLTQAELWGSESEALCKNDPARSHLDDLRNLMTAIWQYPRSLPRQALEERLRILG